MPKLEASRVFPGTVSIVGHVVYSLVDRLVFRVCACNCGCMCECGRGCVAAREE